MLFIFVNFFVNSFELRHTLKIGSHNLDSNHLPHYQITISIKCENVYIIFYMNFSQMRCWGIQMN